MPYKTFTIQEVADYVHLDLRATNELVRLGEIPYEKQGGRLTFRRVDIDQWASQRIIGFEGQELEEYHSTGAEKLAIHTVDEYRVCGLLDPKFMRSQIHAKTTPSLLRRIVDVADETDHVMDKDDLFKSVCAREKLGSTAMTGGYALLHTVHHDPYLFDQSFIVIARTSSAIPFRSPDGQTTDIFFLLCCQDDRLHLHSLARLCLMAQCTSMIYDLRIAADVHEMMDAVRAAEDIILRKK